MNPTSIAIVKSTVPLIQEVGTDLTKHFYGLLFEENPELKNVFNMVSQANGRQQSTLASSILSYAAHIDKLEAIGPEVHRIAAKHFSLDVQPEHYPIVGRNLLKAIREVLGEDIATNEVIDAWAEAYELLASILIGAEANLYDNSQEGQGWLGFKDFSVVKKVKESSEITSFYLAPLDEKPLPKYKAGQFISVRIKDPDLEFTEIRQYSLSDAHSEDVYRISVKAETSGDENTPDGLVSNHLHGKVEEGDIVPVHMPGGEFFVKDNDRPVVLISGGVGITPVLGMLNELILKRDSRKISWLHGTRSKDAHAFGGHINMLKNDLSNLSTATFYEDIYGAEKGKDYDHHGYITADKIKQYCSLDADFFFCGPLPFMHAIHQQLTGLNVPEEQLHYEVFGPSSTL
ncbi:NO-inducible flavohemoprotein [Neptuniibacter sp. QD48_55]|uniref:NO-inducible flavohemoprotein n=1 Tax=Neptuniibacter sp. QD48_55 TaxID=3398212 RepID=UPI0039F6321F